MPSRRQFLVSTGLVGLGMPTVAADSQEKIPAKEVGLSDQVSHLLAQGQIEQAHRLMDQHDIKYSSTRQPIKGGDESNSGSYSPEMVYDESGAWVNCTLVLDTGGGQWVATGAAKHNGAFSFDYEDYSTVDDVSVLYWDNTHWTSPDPTSSNVNLSASGSHSIEYDQYRASATTAWVDLWEKVSRPPREFIVTHQTNLLKSYDGSEVPVAYQYAHTVAPVSGPGVSIGFGPISISVGGKGSVEWKADASADPY